MHTQHTHTNTHWHTQRHTNTHTQTKHCGGEGDAPAAGPNRKGKTREIKKKSYFVQARWCKGGSSFCLSSWAAVLHLLCHHELALSWSLASMGVLQLPADSPAAATCFCRLLPAPSPKQTWLCGIAVSVPEPRRQSVCSPPSFERGYVQKKTPAPAAFT